MKTALLSIIALLGLGLGSCSYDDMWYYLDVNTTAEVVNHRSQDVVARYHWQNQSGDLFDESVILKAGESYQWQQYHSDYEGMGVRFSGYLRVINRLGVDEAIEKVFDEEFSGDRGDYSVKYLVTAED